MTEHPAPVPGSEPSHPASSDPALEQRERAILSLLPMTRRIALGMAKFARNADLGDCFNDGCLGVIRAVDTYDPGRGIPLQRYARPIITGAILNGIRSRDPVTDVARRRLRQAEDRRMMLAQQLGRLPTSREMESLDPELRTANLVAFRSNTLSLDAALPAGAHAAPDWTEDPLAIVSERSEREAIAARVQAAIAALPRQQREVVTKIYFHGYTSTAVAKEWGRTPQRVTQIRTAAESALRERLQTS